jgi:hypothetical protein
MQLFNYVLVAQGLFHFGLACVADDPLKYHAVYESLVKRAQNPPPQPKNTTISNVRFFNGVHFTAPTTVTLADGHIIHVGAGPVAKSSVMIDGSGKFLIPGLIDSHIHISSPSDLDQMAGYGVTTAVNMACYSYKFCESLMNLTGTASMITASQPAVGEGSPHQALGNTPNNQTLSPGVNTTAWVKEFAFPPGNPAAFLKAVAEPGGPDQELLSGVVAAANVSSILL